jgi:hypothetical protein
LKKKRVATLNSESEALGFTYKISLVDSLNRAGRGALLQWYDKNIDDFKGSTFNASMKTDFRPASTKLFSGLTHGSWPNSSTN